MLANSGLVERDTRRDHQGLYMPVCMIRMYKGRLDCSFQLGEHLRYRPTGKMPFRKQHICQDLQSLAMQILANMLLPKWHLASRSIPEMLAELEAAVEPAFVHSDHADGHVETLVISSCISLYQATVCQHRCAALWIDRSVALFESLSDPRKVAAIQICYVARSWVKAHQYVTVAEEG